MRIGVVGLGAVGGLLAARLARAGHSVSALARGETLERVRENGLQLESGGASFSVPLTASDDAAGPRRAGAGRDRGQGAGARRGRRPAMAPLIGPETVLLPAMNGVPWWFLPAALPDEPPLESVDPGGLLLAQLPLAQVLGCVVHLSSSSPAPGKVRHGVGERLIVGEPGGGKSPRLAAVCAALTSAGFRVEPSADVRKDVWYKLWGNMTMNPVSALTGALTDAILDDPLVRGFLLRCMAEAATIGAQIGCPIAQLGDERLALTRELGGFKTSMLQDVEAGRAIELDALVSAVHEIAVRVGIDAPNIGALLGLTRLMARRRGLYPQ